jgi:hypothetical protein
MNSSLDADGFGPWNPGIESVLPSKLLPLVTLMRPENVFTSVDEVLELAAFTGLRPRQLVRFRPERLVTHELLIRVSADFLVPDGSRYEDLGNNARAMVAKIWQDHVAPQMLSITAAYTDLERRAHDQVSDILRATLLADDVGTTHRSNPRSVFERLGLRSSRTAKSTLTESREQRELRCMAQWQRMAEASTEDLHRACCQALHRIASALYGRHGALRADSRLLIRLATDRVLNNYGSDMIGSLIEPFIERGREVEGYRRLPAQTDPVVMNTKGASASGKSTLRPLQRQLAAQLGLDWNDFALISPDIWRKYLLDYDSLGPHYKYAGTLTGDENSIIDRKLDRYMSRKASRGAMSHLVIDRFRFDSFDPDAQRRAGSNLLTRFGRVVYMFFVITPPDATVERAWGRGLKVGRYKAVDDLLDHNVEAFAGMPKLFFTWAERMDMAAHFEFLDNSVAQGELPRTIAYGVGGELNILDVKGMLNIDRYRKIDVNARDPAQVYPRGSDWEAGANADFLRECARRIPVINFVDNYSARIYAQLQKGHLAWVDPELFAQAIADPETRAAFACLAPAAVEGRFHRHKHVVSWDTSGLHTLGQWRA